MQKLILSILLSTSIFSSKVFAEDWGAIEQEARSQTVYFNAWGGSDTINQYVDWATDQIEDLYGVDAKLVKITDVADAKDLALHLVSQRRLKTIILIVAVLILSGLMVKTLSV